jgi:hypothetical protein
VLETAVHDGAEQLRLEQKVAEARGVGAGVGALHLGLGLGRRLYCLLLVILVVQNGLVFL